MLVLRGVRLVVPAPYANWDILLKANLLFYIILLITILIKNHLSINAECNLLFSFILLFV